MSFASEPSWKKHLFLLHRIRRPQPWDYCNDLNTKNQFASQLDKEKVHLQFASIRNRYLEFNWGQKYWPSYQTM